MVGKGVLLECLDSPKVSKVLAIVRRSMNLENAKLKELVVEDFFNLDSVKTQLADYDACFFCLGISSMGQSEESYTIITNKLTMHFAETYLELNPDESVFCYVSGTGTDNSEKGRFMWARVKGKTENALLKLPFKSAYMFRPGYIQPMRGIKPKTKLSSAFYAVFRPIYVVLRYFPNTATNTTNLGKAMINVVDKKSEYQFLGNKEINAMAKD